MNAIRAGVNTYRREYLVPLEQYDWDDYYARLFRYYHYETYFLNTVYTSLINYATTHKNKEGLYRSTRGIYNPVSRQNDLLASYVYGGAIDMERLESGAIPVTTDNEALVPALTNVMKWSKWGENKTLYVRWGARLGDVGLWVVDDRERQKVRLEVVHPAKIREVELDDVGNVKAAILEYERTDTTPVDDLQPGRENVRAEKSYVYTLKVNKERFQTFKDGELYPFYNDANGNPLAEWDNEYGFVPLVMAHHKQTGLRYGANSFHNALRKIDEINDAASLINDQVRKSVNVIWWAAGVRQRSELTATTEDTDGNARKDAVPMIYAPDGSQPHAMIANLPIDQALGNLREMLMELERDMPELALQRIREAGGTMTAPGVRSGYSDAIGRIEEARGLYDDAMTRALQMAVSMGGYNRYEGFESFNLDSYDSGDLDFYIKERPVIADQLTKLERVNMLQGASSASPAFQKLILKELEFDDQTIEETLAKAEAEKQAQTQNAVRAFGESVFGRQGQPDEEMMDDGENPAPERAAA